MALTHKNHFVPRLYLKRFAAASGELFRYRVLVSHPHVPVWQERHIGAIGYHNYLYTRYALGRETDEIESWLNHDFETPAEEPLQKAIENLPLHKSDWRLLIRFLAAQIVRTPAFLVENLPIWHERIPKVLNGVMRNLPRKLEAAEEMSDNPEAPKSPYSEYIPLRVTKEHQAGEDVVKIQAEVVVGRTTWFYVMKHSLATTAQVLESHKWTILRAPDSLQWFTTDDPVVRLNYYSQHKYDFKGGWGQPGTEIFMPLSPQHLLYTQVGKRPEQRGSVLIKAHADMYRQMVAEHAHRQIFSLTPDIQVPSLRPRTVSAELVQAEREQWKNWHDEQSRAERVLYTK